MVTLPDSSASDEITSLAVLDQLTSADSAKRTKRRHQINGLENVSLSLRVISRQQMEAGREIDVESRVVSEIAKFEMR